MVVFVFEAIFGLLKILFGALFSIGAAVISELAVAIPIWAWILIGILILIFIISVFF